MPQLDVSTYPSQLFWLIIFFGILYVFMQWFIVPRVSRIFQKRRVLLDEKLEEIDQFRQEIERLEAQVNLLIETTQKEERELLENAQRECHKLFKDEEIKLQKKAAQSLEIFEKDLLSEVKKIEKELSKSQSDFSLLIAEQALATGGESPLSPDRS